MTLLTLSVYSLHGAITRLVHFALFRENEKHLWRAQIFEGQVFPVNPCDPGASLVHFTFVRLRYDVLS